MKKYILKIAYDGSCFHGWQKQPNNQTVQESIENALKIIAKQKISIVGSGRTDAGVHAENQIAHFYFPINMTTNQIKKAMNSYLPDSILIKDVFEVGENFNARFDAISRIYYYYIMKEKNPFMRNYQSYFPYRKINLQKINSFLPYFLGEHDFTSFCKLNPELNHNKCNVLDINFIDKGGYFLFTIEANRFLHNMVRRIIGTIVFIADKDYSPEIVRELIEKKDNNNKLVNTAPPNGLFLQQIIYPFLLNRK